MLQEMAYRTESVNLEYVNTVAGVQLSAKETANLLTRMSLTSEAACLFYLVAVEFMKCWKTELLTLLSLF